MEVDGHPSPVRQTAGKAARATAEVTVIHGKAEARFRKAF